MGHHGGGWLLFSLVILFLAIYPYIRILQKAGYSGWWILLGFIPLVNLVILWVFALSDWPALRNHRGT